MMTYRCESGRERAPNEPSASGVSAHVRNVRSPVNHTICMRAEIRPKRDRALARAGCYFDGGATVCGVNAFAICEERGNLFRSTRLRVQSSDSASRPRHYGRKAMKPSIAPQAKYGLRRSARNERHVVALSRVRLSARCALKFLYATATRLIAACEHER